MLTSYNDIINTTALNFAATHPGTKTMVFDTFSFLSSVLDDPTLYGIKNITNYCPNYDAPDIASKFLSIFIPSHTCKKIEGARKQ